MNVKDLVEEIGYTPKKKAACHGGEFCSPCPFCKEGNDRFLIWPNRSNKNGEYQGGRFSCRVCGKYGDAITFLKELHGISYNEACEKLRIEPRKRGVTPAKKEIKLPVVNDPSELWQKKALSFVDWSHHQLMKNPAALNLIQKRGFTLDSIKRFKLGYNPLDLWREREEWGVQPEKKDDGSIKKLWLPAGITIPAFSGDQVIKIKVRRPNWKEGDKLPKYVELSGSKQCPSVYGDTNLKVGLILESELDSLLVQQETGDLLFCVALGGSSKLLDAQTDQLLRQTSILLFCPDFDKAGAKAWVKWKKMFPSIQRVLTPDGKSAGDAFLAGVNLREWLSETIENIQRKNR